jgi:hypothetical protein
MNGPDKHHMEVVEMDDGGWHICFGCKASGALGTRPPGECPTPWLDRKQLLTKIAERDILLQRAIDESDGMRDEYSNMDDLVKDIQIALSDSELFTPFTHPPVPEDRKLPAPVEKCNVKPVLLWKAPMQPKHEPVALLSYGGKTFAIPYTLMDWIRGWVVMGQVGTAVAAPDAIDQTRAALEGIVSMMGRDANRLTPAEIEFYKGHGLYREPQWPVIKDYSAPGDQS